MVLGEARAYFVEVRKYEAVSCSLTTSWEIQGRDGWNFPLRSSDGKEWLGFKNWALDGEGYSVSGETECDPRIFFTNLKGEIMQFRDREVDILDRIARI